MPEITTSARLEAYVLQTLGELMAGADIATIEAGVEERVAELLPGYNSENDSQKRVHRAISYSLSLSFGKYSAALSKGRIERITDSIGIRVFGRG